MQIKVIMINLIFFQSSIFTMNIHQTPDWFPPHLKDCNYSLAPKDVKSFANKYSILNVVFVDDPIKCNRSVRYNSNVFINVRATYWDAMILPPWLCTSPAEAILQRLLHEIGHHACKHSGDSGIQSTSNGLIVRQTDPWDVLRGNEKEAWKFCFNIRENSTKEYLNLLELITNWYKEHEYEGKDWEDTPEIQWKSKNGNSLPSDLWQLIPKWVREEFKSD